MGNIKYQISNIKNNIIKIFICFVLLFLLSGFHLFAQEINFETSIDRTKVSLGKGVQLSLTFHGTQDVSAPDMPEINGVESRYLGPSTMMSIVNGKVSSSITHNYILVPLKEGVFTVPSISVAYRGKTYQSRPINIEVVRGPVSEKLPSGVPEEEEMELEDRVFLVMQADKAKVYLNESIPVVIKLYVNRLSIRDVEYPQFAHEGFSAGEYDKPAQYQDALGGVQYNVIEFRKNIFGIKPGEFKLGPAQVKCNLVVRKERRRPTSTFDDFFGEDVFQNFFERFQAYPLSLKSQEIPIAVMPLPESGKPADFSGAVGDFRFDIEAEPQEIKVGDPITLKMTVSGRGNFNTVTAPKLESEEGFKIYEPQIKVEGDSKIFEQILMPLSDDVKEIPKINFSYFDPGKGYYRTITRGPVPISVKKPLKEEELKVVELPRAGEKPIKEEKLGRDIIYIKENPGKLMKKDLYIYKNKGFLLLQILPMAFLISILTLYRKSERLKTDIRYARRLRAPKKVKEGIRKSQKYLSENNASEFYNTVFKALQEYLGDKFHLPIGGITIDIVDDVLKAKGIKEEILNKLKELFRDCDMARYAPSEFGKMDMNNTLGKLEEAIDYFERSKVK